MGSVGENGAAEANCGGVGGRVRTGLRQGHEDGREKESL